MPAQSPPLGNDQKKRLRHFGEQIRMHRKLLKLSAVATAEASGISRMTLNRIESGEASVTLGAYLNVISALGLEVELIDPKAANKATNEVPEKIHIADYPQLKKLAWQLKDTTELTAKEALDLYERNWRHIEKAKLSANERQFIRNLLVKLGRSALLV